MGDMEPSTSSPSASSLIVEGPFIRPRRELFEHGLLPIPKLIFLDPGQSLVPIKEKLLKQSSESLRASAPVISDILQISIDHSRVVLDTIASVLHSKEDPLINAAPSEVESVGANVYDLILFLYIQSYKRLLPRTHKDAAVVADVWPSTSAFDGYLSALSPLQLVRTNSRRFMPSQADEEAHQLSYLQKHSANILALLAEHVEGEEEESLVMGMERLEHVGFLIQFVDNNERVPIRQAAPFFANSHADMPAVAVSASVVHGWLMDHMTSSLEHLHDRVIPSPLPPKENGPASSCSPPSDDITMTDAAAAAKASTSNRGPMFVEGIAKSSYVRQAADLKGHTIKVLNCHDSAIYILAPLRYATVYGCSDATIVLGAVGKGLRVEHCERVHVVVAAKRICIANCRECVFFLGVNHRPLVIGDNHKLQVGPYNTWYAELTHHMKEMGIEGSVNRWNEPVLLGADTTSPENHSQADPLSPVRVKAVDPEQLVDLVIPSSSAGEAAVMMGGRRRRNPFALPEAYAESQARKQKKASEMRELLREGTAELEYARMKDLSCALHVHFKEWLYSSGNIRHLYFLQAD